MALFIALDWFPRRVDEIVLAWLSIALLNEALLHSKVIHYLFRHRLCGILLRRHFAGEIARAGRGWQAPFF